MKTNCIIFPHIPKCGGTSLKKQFEESNLKVFFDYEFPPNSTQKYYNDLCERRNKESSYVDFGGCDLVFGHFPISRYKQKKYTYITLLRSPVERAWSQYNYFKEIPEINLPVALVRYPIISEIRKGNVNFLDFLKLNNMDSFYRNFLDSLDPSDYLLVGFSDKYDSFSLQLSEILNIKFDANIRERKGSGNILSEIDAANAQKLLKPEIELFEDFKKHWY